MRRDDAGPYSLDTLAKTPVPQLFTSDPAVLKSRYVAWFEQASGRTLYPMQVEMLLIEALAYAMAVLGEEAQATAEQHLVAKASIGGLVALGPNRSTPRLPASKARTTLRLTLPAPATTQLIVPSGMRARAGDNGMVFSTLGTASFAAGTTYVDIVAEAAEEGEAGNGFEVGQITTLLDPRLGLAVSNVTESSGGSSIEDVEAYRLRLANAFERISTGGSRAWYREQTMSVSSAIIDVAVIRPDPCYVDIYPLTQEGPAGPELRGQVAAALSTASSLDSRFGDEVTVKVADEVTYEVDLAITARGNFELIEAQALELATRLCSDWDFRFGAERAPSQIEGFIQSIQGVADVTASGFAYGRLEPTEYGRCTAINITMIDPEA